jgi:hypothetical protein
MSETITSTIIDRLQLGSMPANIGYAEYIRNNIYIYRDAYQTFPAYQREWFFQLVERKISRLFEMEEKGNWNAAWDLYIEAKLNFLQGPGELKCRDQDPLAYHDTIDEALFDISCLHEPWKFVKGLFPSGKHNYIDAAKTCRETRKHMYLCRVDHDENMICVHHAMIPTLDIIQPRA